MHGWSSAHRHECDSLSCLRIRSASAGNSGNPHPPQSRPAGYCRVESNARGYWAAPNGDDGMTILCIANERNQENSRNRGLSPISHGFAGCVGGVSCGFTFCHRGNSFGLMKIGLVNRRRERQAKPGKRAGVKKPQQANTCGAMGYGEEISYILDSW